MADLPDIRFHEKEPPLNYTDLGLDYNGPCTVIQRGKEEKAFICLFNCLVTRALHFEMTKNLTTLSVWQLFVDPLLNLDNHCSYYVITEATSLEPENKSEDKMCSWTMTLSDNLLNPWVEWLLNPHSAPHFGGMYKRPVQILIRALVLNLDSAQFDLGPLNNHCYRKRIPS